MFRSGTRHRTWPRLVLPMQSDGIGTVSGDSAEAAGPLAPSWQLFREHEVARGALSRVYIEFCNVMLRAAVRAL